MNTQVRNTIKLLLGKPCCRQRVSQPKSLSLGFGEKVYHGKPRLIDTFYGEWEMGAYYSAWRIIRDRSVLCGSTDSVDSLDELNKELSRIAFGRIASVENLTDFDVRVECDSGIAIDILATASDGDESFHIFCPNKLYIEFSPGRGWNIGGSNKPWDADNSSK